MPWKILIVLTLLYSHVASSNNQLYEGFPVTTDCRPTIQRGIGVGNNNYKGDDCKAPVETTDAVVIIHEVYPLTQTQGVSRTPSSEKKWAIPNPNGNTANGPTIHYIQPQIEYDYGSED